ncbi:MAG: histidine kinase [Thermoleophilia bacterium]|nr:histidine kinase [Thermoleophilia bacterium]
MNPAIHSQIGHSCAKTVFLYPCEGMLLIRAAVELRVHTERPLDKSGTMDSSYQISTLVEVVAAVFDGIVFLTLALVGLTSLIRTRDGVAGWFAGMFFALGGTVALGLIVDPGPETSVWFSRISIATLALIPFFLYRFTRSFARGNSWVDVVSTILTVVVVVWSCTLTPPPEGAAWGRSFAIFAITFLAHWTILSIASAWFFLREARQTLGVASRRMRLFAGATLALAGAILLSSFTGNASGTQLIIGVVVQLGGAASALLFWFALAPPRALRASWRARELQAMEGGLRSLLEGETVDDVRERTLQAALRLTGGIGAIMLDQDGLPCARLGLDEDAGLRVAAAARGGEGNGRGASRLMAVDRIVVACGPSAPFFGVDERQLLDSLSAFASLGEGRARTLERERDANERLRQVDQLKSEFVAMVAHDLRTPMSVISGFADMIRTRWDDMPDERKLELLQLISHNTHSLSEFVEDVLQVAQMESGEFRYDAAPFDPRTVVQRIVRDMEIAHPEIKLVIESPPELPAALGDAERNWQILTNLVSNAMKFSAGAPCIHVQLRTLPEEGAVAIAVRDEGVGISTEDMPRLFRRFSRVGPTRLTVAGTGLGLYIVKTMVEAQGGRIWVTSEPGQGSTFTYTLPLADR